MLMTPKLKLKLDEAVKDPVYDNMGNIVMTATFHKHHIGIKSQSKAYFYKQIPEEKLIKHSNMRNSRPGGAVFSMTFGKKTREMGWDTIQHPAVYAVISKSTGRMYVGSTTRPDLRRAVHKFWLTNYWKFGTSNTFFGNLQLADDVKTYGVDDFYLEIIKPMPDADTLELREAEAEYQQSISPTLLYNAMFAFLDKMGKFYYVDNKFKKVSDKLLAATTAFKEAEKDLSMRIKSKNVLREQLRQQYEDDEISNKEFIALNEEISIEHKIASKRLTELKKLQRQARGEYKEINKKMRDKYSKVKKPTY